MNNEEMIKQFHKVFPFVVTVDDVMRLCLKLKDERDHSEEQAKRWRTEALLNAAYPRTKPDEQG